MKSTKRFLPVLAIGLVFFFTSTLAADVTANYPSTLTVDLQCTNTTPITVTGPTAVNIQSNSDSDGTHIVVHFQIRADGQDSPEPPTLPNPYHVNLEGTLQLTVNPGDPLPSSFPVPFHSQWVGQGTAVNFPLSGIMAVSIDENGNVSSAPQSGTCTN